MKILVTNDDGIEAASLWVLVEELRKVARVTVVAPDRERSAIGTAVTLFQPLHAESFPAPVAGVTAYSVDGSPSDCVILALGKLIEDRVDLVVSGINPNLNLGEDVHISGTVGGALQGYFRGLPAIAISAPRDSQPGLDSAARVAACLAEGLARHAGARLFLNVNVPDLTLEETVGVRITRLARSSHINTVEEDNHDARKHYWLVRERLTGAEDDGTDIQAVEQGYISLTPLYSSLLDKPPQRLLKKLSAALGQEVARGKKTG
jgi:5'-nucleotidase